MLKQLRPRSAYDVLALLAFLIAVGTGSAYAANTIGSADIIDDSILSVDIKNGEVKSGDLASSAVTNPKIANESISSIKLGLNAVTGDKVLDNTLTGTDISESTLGKVPAAANADTAAGLRAPEAWREVAAASTTGNLCADPNVTATFCSENRSTFWATWGNYGGDYATAAFYKDRTGIVHLKGLVQSNFLSRANFVHFRSIFGLPASYRPNRQRMFTIVGGSDNGLDVAVGRVDVRPDGMVVLAQDCTSTFDSCSANRLYFSLDGISFRPDG